jgi:hypothetical protein
MTVLLHWFPVWQPLAIALLSALVLGCVRYWYEAWEGNE